MSADRVTNDPEAHRSRKLALVGPNPFILALLARTHKEFLMKKKSKKRVSLLVSAMSVCAFMMPSMVSAASWHGPFPSTHILDSSNPSNRLSFSIAAINAGWSCEIWQLHVDIRSASDATITNALFRNCMGTGAAVDCTITATATRLPWTVTNPTTTNVTIDGVHVDLLYENTPGHAACALPGTVTLTGNLNGGIWSNAGHELTFNAATGLTGHIDALAGSFPAALTGTLADTSGNLTMTD